MGYLSGVYIRVWLSVTRAVPCKIPRDLIFFHGLSSNMDVSPNYLAELTGHNIEGSYTLNKSESKWQSVLNISLI